MPIMPYRQGSVKVRPESRVVVNLDGLVNDLEFLEQLRSGTSILEYLKRDT
jgi:hypothetical protein